LTALTRTIPGLLEDLRADHAGEAGAVMINCGILAVSRDLDLRLFATQHLRTEQAHLELMEVLVPPRMRSLLLPLWRAAGWLTGFLPALAGPHATYQTIAAVERFVVAHYDVQIQRLAAHGAPEALLAILEDCQSDEAAHRDQAAARCPRYPGAVMSLWLYLVELGSHYGVIAARRL
jgi:ubiquinone biosynthesis monooxygenase Coq7